MLRASVSAEGQVEDKPGQAKKQGRVNFEIGVFGVVSTLLLAYRRLRPFHRRLSHSGFISVELH